MAVATVAVFGTTTVFFGLWNHCCCCWNCCGRCDSCSGGWAAGRERDGVEALEREVSDAAALGARPARLLLLAALAVQRRQHAAQVRHRVRCRRPARPVHCGALGLLARTCLLLRCVRVKPNRLRLFATQKEPREYSLLRSLILAVTYPYAVCAQCHACVQPVVRNPSAHSRNFVFCFTSKPFSLEGFLLFVLDQRHDTHHPHSVCRSPPLCRHCCCCCV